MFNKVQLIGRLTKDNTFKTTSSGTEICENSLALNKKTKDSEKTIFIKNVVIGKSCNVMRGYTKKSDKIAIIGELNYDSWTDKNGNHKSEHSIIVEVIELLGNQRWQGDGKEVNNPTQKSAKERLSEEIDCDDEIPF